MKEQFEEYKKSQYSIMIYKHEGELSIGVGLAINSKIRDFVDCSKFELERVKCHLEVTLNMVNKMLEVNKVVNDFKNELEK